MSRSRPDLRSVQQSRQVRYVLQGTTVHLSTQHPSHVLSEHIVQLARRCQRRVLQGRIVLLDHHHRHHVLPETIARHRVSRRHALLGRIHPQRVRLQSLPVLCVRRASIVRALRHRRRRVQLEIFVRLDPVRWIHVQRDTIVRRHRHRLYARRA